MPRVTRSPRTCKSSGPDPADARGNWSTLAAGQTLSQIRDHGHLAHQLHNFQLYPGPVIRLHRRATARVGIAIKSHFPPAYPWRGPCCCPAWGRSRHGAVCVSMPSSRRRSLRQDSRNPNPGRYSPSRTPPRFSPIARATVRRDNTPRFEHGPLFQIQPPPPALIGRPGSILPVGKAFGRGAAQSLTSRIFNPPGRTITVACRIPGVTRD